MSSRPAMRRVFPRKREVYALVPVERMPVMTIGDWICECGQLYRVLIDGDSVSMWPESASQDFREQPIDGCCVCGRPVDPSIVEAAIV